MNNRTPFANLKTALLIIESNHSSIMQKVAESRTKLRFDEDISIQLKMDYLPALTYIKGSAVYTIKYNKSTYCFTDSYLSLQSPLIVIDHSKVETASDMLAVSTITDFYDLTYNDIESLRYLIQQTNKNLGKIIINV